MTVKWNQVCRKTHRWCSIVIALPLLVIMSSGMLLLLKKQISWIQPETKQGGGEIPGLSFPEILEISTTVPEAQIKGWDSIDRLDVRPSRGIIKIRAKNHWEIQIDFQTGEILQTAYRRSDIFESIHDGSIIHKLAKPWLFLTFAFGLLLLWLTGIYMFISFHRAKRKSKNAKAFVRRKDTAILEGVER